MEGTAGKPPPPIAINSGGGIQILNMNAVRAAAGGATLVPQPGPMPGGAQAGGMVGSPGPGPPGKQMGPRMISITPQMLHNRPGQPLSSSDSTANSLTSCKEEEESNSSSSGGGSNSRRESPLSTINNNNNSNENDNGENNDNNNKGSKTTTTNCDENENRPKLMPLMDVNLADFMFIDCDDDEVDGGIGRGTVVGSGSENSSSNNNFSSTNNNNNNTSSRPWIQESQQSNKQQGIVPSEESFTPTKTSEEFTSTSVINMEDISSQKESLTVLRVPTIVPVPEVTSSSSADGITAWNKRYENFTTRNQNERHTITTAFQMHTIGEGHLRNSNTLQQHQHPQRFHNHHNQQQQIAVRNFTGGGSNAQHPPPSNSFGSSGAASLSQQQQQQHQSPHLNSAYSWNSTTHHGVINGSNVTSRDPNSYSTFIRANNPVNASNSIATNSLNSEYKSNSRSQHLQSFTNDPQLHSQFIQYTQNYPLSHSRGASDPGKGPMISFSQPTIVPPGYQQPQRPRFIPSTFGRPPQSQYPAFSQQQHNNIVRHPTGVPSLQQHLQQSSPSSHYVQSSAHGQVQLRPQYQQNRSVQPQPHYRECSNYIPNGCDNSNKQMYYVGNMQQVYRSEAPARSNPNYIAHNQSTTSVPLPVPVQQQQLHFRPSIGNHTASVIRPNTYSGGSVVSTTSISSTSNVSTTTSNSNNNNRLIYGASSSCNYYAGNQTSVIRAHQSSNSSGSSSNSSVVSKEGYNTSGYNSSSSGGELTLRSFLSNPSAPFMCPSTTSPNTTGTSFNSAERASMRSGYYDNNESWGTPCISRGDQNFTDQEHSQLSSCQYSDAMTRNNAPITLQALSGLPPGANHLLVKTENGQFQLVSVRMQSQSPTAAAAAPGTPVIPSTVAVPPTSMSIAQQLPSSSPLAPPPLPPHSTSSGPPMVPPISSSIITTTTIPPHPSQQGRIITSSSSNHIVTSWSSSNNNSLVNNNSTTSSPLPMISTSAAHPLPPHPSSAPSSVIMPPNHSASNSQLLISTANNISSSTSSSTYSSAAQAAVAAAATAYQQRTSQQSAAASGSVPGGPPPPVGGQPPPPLHNSLPSVITPTGAMNNLPPGASVIRSGGIGTSNLPPPPPVIVSGTTSSAAPGSVTSSSLVTSTPSAAPPTVPATFRPQSTTSQVPNNNASNNASGVGMMMPGSNSMFMSGHPHHHHPIHPSYSHLHPNTTVPPHAQQYAPSTSYTSNKVVSPNSTANTVSQMSNETAKNKCKNFLSFLLELSAKQNQTVARNVKNLIQGLIDGKVNEENFADRLQKEVNSQPQPCLVGFLKKSLPHLRHSLATNELKIDGIKPPPLSTLVPPAPVSAIAPQTPPTPSERKQTPPVRPTTPTVPNPVRILTPPVNSASPSAPPTPTSSSSASAPPTPTSSPSPSSTKSSKSKGSSSKSKSSSAKAAAAAAAASNDISSGSGSNSSVGPSGTPSTKSSIPSSKSSKEKEKKDKTFSSSGYSADDDINDVAAMGGVNLAEESQRILGSTEYVGTQIRSCRDETMIQPSPIIAKFKGIAAKYGLEDPPSTEVSALLSHAVEERLKTIIEKLSVIAEHRMDVIKLDERYEITQDVKGQLKFLEELDKLEKKRHDEQEREMLIRAAKSRSKSEDPEQAKLKAKAKEMQRVALEEMRQRDANLTALQAIGPRKKPKLDTAVGSQGSAMPSPLGATGASSSLGRPQMSLRPRLKRVNLRDLLFLLEHDKETMRSPFLYKNLLLK